MGQRLALLTDELDGNSLGRAYCLWLLARAAGWDARVLASRGAEVWRPLQETEFAASCERVESSDLDSMILAGGFDLLIAVKPLPGSFGRALRVSEASGVPLLLDIDDPDLERLLSWGSPLRRLRRLVRDPFTEFAYGRLRKRAAEVELIVSNPALQTIYGGAVVPHVREDYGHGGHFRESNPVVAFVGTNRSHKGLDVIRAGVARVQDLGFKLAVTDAPPADAYPWESWVGTTSLSAGIELVADSDIVLVPSQNSVWSRGQLPVKLVDAMLLGRAVGVSRVEPLPWAIGEAGLTFEPTVDGVERVLRQLRNVGLRERLGAGARERALSMFTVDAALPAFRAACDRARVRPRV